MLWADHGRFQYLGAPLVSVIASTSARRTVVCVQKELCPLPSSALPAFVITVPSRQRKPPCQVVVVHYLFLLAIEDEADLEEICFALLAQHPCLQGSYNREGEGAENDRQDIDVFTEAER